MSDDRSGSNSVNRGVFTDDDDLYALLNVHSKSTASQIRSAYLHCSRLHPDKLPQQLTAELPTSELSLSFTRLTLAHSILTDMTTRRVYDQHGITGVLALTSVHLQTQLRSDQSINNAVTAIIKSRAAANEVRHERSITDGISISTSTRALILLNAYRLFGYAPIPSRDRLRPLGIQQQHLIGAYPKRRSMSSFIPIDAVAYSLKQSTEMTLSADDTLTIAIECDRRGNAAKAAPSLSYHHRLTRNAKISTSVNTNALNAAFSYSLFNDIQIEPAIKYNWSSRTWTPSLSITESHSQRSQSQWSIHWSRSGDPSLSYGLTSLLTDRIQSESGIDVSANAISLQQKISAPIGRRKRLRVWARLSSVIPHSLPLPIHTPDELVTPLEQFSYVTERLDTSLAVGFTYAFQRDSHVSCYVDLSHGNGVLCVAAVKLHSFLLTFPIQITPQFDWSGALTALTVPIVSVTACRLLYRYYLLSRRRQECLDELNESGRRIWNDRRNVIAWIQTLKRTAERIQQQERSSVGGICIKRALYEYEGVRHNDPLFPAMIDVTPLLQCTVNAHSIRLHSPSAMIQSMSAEANRDERAPRIIPISAYDLMALYPDAVPSDLHLHVQFEFCGVEYVGSWTELDAVIVDTSTINSQSPDAHIHVMNEEDRESVRWTAQLVERMDVPMW